MTDGGEFVICLSSGRIEAIKEGIEITVDRGDVDIKIRGECEEVGCDYEYSRGADCESNIVEHISCKYCGDVKYTDALLEDVNLAGYYSDGGDNE